MKAPEVFLLAVMLVAVASTGCVHSGSAPRPTSSEPGKELLLPASFQHRVPPTGRLYKDCTADIPSECELHHIKMSRESVAVVGYGLVPPSFKNSPYPHGGQPVDSGCVGPGSGPVYAYVWICPQCEEAWVKAGRPRGS